MAQANWKLIAGVSPAEFFPASIRLAINATLLAVSLKTTGKERPRRDAACVWWMAGGGGRGGGKKKGRATCLCFSTSDA